MTPRHPRTRVSPSDLHVAIKHSEHSHTMVSNPAINNCILGPLLSTQQVFQSLFARMRMIIGFPQVTQSLPNILIFLILTAGISPSLPIFEVYRGFFPLGSSDRPVYHGNAQRVPPSAAPTVIRQRPSSSLRHPFLTGRTTTRCGGPLSPSRSGTSGASGSSPSSCCPAVSPTRAPGAPGGTTWIYCEAKEGGGK